MIVRSEDSPVVIVHDYLTQRGGAERVVLAMSRAFPGAPVVTSVFDPPRTYEDYRRLDVRTTRLQKLPLLARHHRAGLPLYATTFKRLTVDAPVVICSTSGWAHGVHVTGVKALYVYNTARWLYQTDEYLEGRYATARALARPLQRSLRRWDQAAAASADHVWAISKAVQERVRAHWSSEPELLYPPHGADPEAPRDEVPGLQPSYLLAVARLLHYKRVDVLAESMRHLPDHQLVVVGDGPEGRQLRAGAPGNVRFLSRVSEGQLRWLYANCLGLVAAAHEDLGLAPLEAMAFGRPVAVLRRGGYLETVVEGENGVFFDDPTPTAVAAAVRALATQTWSTTDIASWANRFSEQAFAEMLKARVRQLSGDSVHN